MARRPRYRADIARCLDEVFARCHRPSFIDPDPLAVVRRYSDLADREIIALVAAGLAYGRVQSILNSLERIVAVLGPHPARAVPGRNWSRRAALLAPLRHRWTTGAEMVSLIEAASRLQRQRGSVEAAFADGWGAGDPDCVGALEVGVRALMDEGAGLDNSLLSLPARGGACKRLLLFLRWMVRCDEVDPGGWRHLPASSLLVPVDVHMHRIARSLGLTQRTAADLRTVREITAAFRVYAPDDPVRYDFALTRLPIRDRLSPDQLRRTLLAGL